MPNSGNAPETREIVIADYGMGNLGSVANMIRHVGCSAIISADTNVVANATHLILPGVGNFAYGMKRLNEVGMDEALHAARDKGSRILGICLGMQLMTRSCEEGMCDGLGWFDFDTVRFPGQTSSGERLLVPHMGWNHVEASRGATQFETVPTPSQFYFVHSYYVDGAGAHRCLATTEYGDIAFASAIGEDKVTGVQFHPEKSHKFGIAFLRDFVGR